MRVRQIKPAIVTNEELAALGPYAYILFTGLWMLADREGRFEWRPKKIKALLMPMWDEISTDDVENLLEKLWKSGFLNRYEAESRLYGEVLNFKKHQHIHPAEAHSEIPAPTVKAMREAHASDPESAASEEAVGLPGITGNYRENCSFTSLPSLPSVRRRVFSPGEISHSDEKNSPPPPSAQRKPPTQTQTQTPKRKQPAKETQSADGPREAAPKARDAPSDFWPHKLEDVSILRESLSELGKQCGLPPPDDEIIRRILDAGRGADGRAIHGLLVALSHRQKFRDMRSWGLLPLLVEQYAHVA
jgi:hypothetical protein